MSRRERRARLTGWDSRTGPGVAGCAGAVPDGRGGVSCPGV
ncbi:MAG: hypothetical protein Q4F41_00615 [Eubacteriales bacterium]|nr:hypothetical protein [Eubacteriales bacterium]